jgi:hypothetical protein
VPIRRDLFLIERSAPLAARAEIVSLVAERLPSHYDLDPISEVPVFAPVYSSPLGIDALNEALRAAINPDREPVGGGSLRICDKLMITGRNLHELVLMNGTVLQLIDEIDGSDADDAALLLAADGQIVRLPATEAGRAGASRAHARHGPAGATAGWPSGCSGAMSSGQLYWSARRPGRRQRCPQTRKSRSDGPICAKQRPQRLEARKSPRGASVCAIEDSGCPLCAVRPRCQHGSATLRSARLRSWCAMLGPCPPPRCF